MIRVLCRIEWVATDYAIAGALLLFLLLIPLLERNKERKDER